MAILDQVSRFEARGSFAVDAEIFSSKANLASDSFEESLAMAIAERMEPLEYGRITGRSALPGAGGDRDRTGADSWSTGAVTLSPLSKLLMEPSLKGPGGLGTGADPRGAGVHSRD